MGAVKTIFAGIGIVTVGALLLRAAANRTAINAHAEKTGGDTVTYLQSLRNEAGYLLRIR